MNDSASNNTTANQAGAGTQHSPAPTLAERIVASGRAEEVLALLLAERFAWLGTYMLPKKRGILSELVAARVATNKALREIVDAAADEPGGPKP